MLKWYGAGAVATSLEMVGSSALLAAAWVAAAAGLCAGAGTGARPAHDAFKRLNPAQDVKLGGRLRSSEQRRLRTALREQYPAAVDALDSGALWATGAWGVAAAGARGGGETGQVEGHARVIWSTLC